MSHPPCWQEQQEDQCSTPEPASSSGMHMADPMLHYIRANMDEEWVCIHDVMNALGLKTQPTLCRASIIKAMWPVTKHR